MVLSAALQQIKGVWMRNMKLTKNIFFVVSFHYYVSKYTRVVDPGGLDPDQALHIKTESGSGS